MRNKYVDETANINNSNPGSNNKIYKFVRLKETVMNDSCSIGDFSKVDFCELNEYVRIDRFNHIYKSKIARHTYTGMNTVIMHADIGAFCSIAWGVTIGPANHNYKNVTSHSFLYNDYDNLRPLNHIAYDRFEEKCEIGNDVWIGCNAIILRGVAVGNGAVIGANAVVNKDVPPYAVVAGSPAKIIKYRFDEETIDLLLNLKWWEWSYEKIKNNFSFFESEPEKKEIMKLLKKQEEKE